tara:strand:- start:27161 stop:27355 length:195 start_codon:yes stop_codon:yes gene_type:complete
MRTFGLFCFAALFASLLPANESFAHMYDTVGVEAAPHVHDDHTDSEAPMKDNCFIDPKLGPICK